jgi:molybdopterin-guanine dinucleotide biosynthesis protein A
MPDEAITGFVLAGGQATRMGTDKAALPWGEGTLAEHITNLLSAVAEPVRIVGRDPLPDIEPGRGPLEGIRTALRTTTTKHNLITAVDLPFLDPQFLNYLATRLRATSSDLVLCRIQGYVAISLGAHRALLGQVEDYLASGHRSLQGFAASVEHEEISEDDLQRAGFGAEIFRNINTPEDYKRERDA